MDDQQPQIMSWIKAMFQTLGIEQYEEPVSDMGLEFLTMYLNELIGDITLFCEHDGRSQPNISDIKMAIKMKQRTTSSSSKDPFRDRVTTCNATTLPQEFLSTVELPKPETDTFTLLQRNYRIKTNEDFDDDEEEDISEEEENRLDDLPSLPTDFHV